MKEKIYKTGAILLIILSIYIVLRITVFLLPFVLGAILIFWLIRQIKNKKQSNKETIHTYDTYTKKSEHINTHNGSKEVIDVDYEEVNK